MGVGTVYLCSRLTSTWNEPGEKGGLSKNSHYKTWQNSAFPLDDLPRNMKTTACRKHQTIS